MKDFSKEITRLMSKKNVQLEDWEALLFLVEHSTRKSEREKILEMIEMLKQNGYESRNILEMLKRELKFE